MKQTREHWRQVNVQYSSPEELNESALVGSLSDDLPDDVLDERPSLALLSLAGGRPRLELAKGGRVTLAESPGKVCK